MHRNVTLALLVAATGIVVPPAAGQVLYGSLVGVVRDSSDAAVADAAVSIRERATGLARQTQTTGAGQFQFPAVPGGRYQIAVTRAGFSKYQSDDVVVSVNAVSRVDVVLQVGAVAESVQVEAAPPTLQTDRAEVRSEITAKQFENAPLPPGRNYTQMFKTLPGFTYPKNGNGPAVDPSRAALYNVNGTSRSSNAVRIEGSGVNQVWLPHLPGFTPALEAIETVNVTTNSFDAETGLAGGVAVNLQIKSGTNDLRGSLFEYHNSNATKAKPFFLPVDERKPKAVFNQMGGTLGGRIIRNKLFYFGSYEGTFDRQFGSRLETIPLPAVRRGDMSASSTAIYDPATGAANGSGRTPFPGNQVPAARFDPVALRIQSLLPAPTYDTPANNYFAQGPYRFDSHKMDAKINWNISDGCAT
jgi:hypothetical protein